MIDHPSGLTLQFTHFHLLQIPLRRLFATHLLKHLLDPGVLRLIFGTSLGRVAAECVGGLHCSAGTTMLNSQSRMAVMGHPGCWGWQMMLWVVKVLCVQNISGDGSERSRNLQAPKEWGSRIASWNHVSVRF